VALMNKKRTYSNPIWIMNRIFRPGEWGIGIIDKRIDCFLNDSDIISAKWIIQPKKRYFYADPFGIDLKGEKYIFCEKFDYDLGLGKICAFKIDKNNIVTKCKVNINCNKHISYPYIFEYEGNIYCVPETASAKEVSLFKATTFPSTWKREKVLLSGVSICDPTIIHFQDKWWMWGTDAAKSSNGTLMLWYSDSPLGPWIDHPQNPIKECLRSSRPAGTPFVVNNILYRPAQDCTHQYGKKIVINQIQHIGIDFYLEHEFRIIRPNKASRYKDGIHTVSGAGNFTLIDGKVSQLNLRALRFNLKLALIKTKMALCSSRQ
jgi:hypothetical protein